VKFARAVGWPSLLAAAAYLAAFGSVVYVGDFRFSDELFFLAPLVFGFAIRRWWATIFPLLILLPLPIVLVAFPPGENSEFGALGIAFLVAFWTAAQCLFVGIGIGLGVAASSLVFRPTAPR
jgi:hypothetical protein